MREGLGRKSRDLFVENLGIRRERVANPKAVMANKTDDIAGIGFVHRLTLIAKQLMRTGKTHLLLGTRVMHRHVALELAGTHADESNAVTVLWVHVRLNLEDES